MKNTFIKLGSFRFKVTVSLIITLFVMSALTNFIVCKFALTAQFDQIRQKLMALASVSSIMVDADTLSRVPLAHDGVNTPQFKSLAEALTRIKEKDPIIKYIYVLAKTDKESILQFVVDPDYQSETGKSYPGDEYDASNYPDMLKGFEGPSADKKLMLDAWGVTLSGYAPIKSQSGKTVAILGVDIAAKDIYHIQKEIYFRMLLVLFISIFTAVALGLLVSAGIIKPIDMLVDGTRRISYGDLHHRVEIKGKDEMAELAASFNDMAQVLSESRDNLRDYFYRVVQTLVSTIEARDYYTKGHSERVADYSEKIALKMSFSGEKVESLKRAALLHDIGKLGVQESILNKKDKLLDAEWEIIKRHPKIGEEILKPVLSDEEMLSVVRSHHERYDGKGYPDKLNGEEINLFAQIVSVADAYDAMTSARAYRGALRKDVAIQELIKNSGSQFSPKVTKVFIEILNAEEKA